MYDDLMFRKIYKISLDDKPVRSMEWGELHESRSKVKKAMETLITAAEKDNRELNEDEESAWKMGEDVIENINKEFSEREAMGTKAPRTIKISGGKVTRNADTDAGPLQGTIGRTYRERVYGDKDARLDLGPFVSREEYYRGVVNNAVEMRYMSVAVGSEGGFSAPEQLIAEYWDGAFEEALFANRMRQYTATGPTANIIGWESHDHGTGPIGGVKCSFQPEGAPADFVTPKLRLIGLQLKKASMYLDISREAAEDGIRLQDQVGQMMTRSLSYFVDDQFLNGKGGGECLGLYNSPALLSVTRTTANTVTYEDIIQMWGKLLPQMQRNAVWVCSPDVMPELLGMVDGANHYIFLPNSVAGAASGVPMTLLGKPILVTERAKTLSQSGCLALCDPSAYAWITRRGMVMESTNSFRFSEDKTSIRVLIRVDGTPLMDKPVTPANGGAQLSWAVQLAA
jgi:HK97 family phage major capsid protein